MNLQSYLAYANVFADGPLSVSSEQEGFEGENAVDGFTHDAWKPESGVSPSLHWLTVTLDAAAPCDYLAIHAHNLFSQGATITLKGSANGSAWSTVAGPYSPASDGPQLWRFASATYAYWRIEVAGDEISLGVLQAGAILRLPEGMYVGVAPASLNRQPKIMNNKTEGGAFIGRSLIRQGAGIDVKIDHADPSWVRTYWTDFVEHAELKPFFFAWRHDTYPQEVIYGWADEPPRASHASVSHMKASLSIEGQVE